MPRCRFNADRHHRFPPNGSSLISAARAPVHDLIGWLSSSASVRGNSGKMPKLASIYSMVRSSGTVPVFFTMNCRRSPPSRWVRRTGEKRFAARPFRAGRRCEDQHPDRRTRTPGSPPARSDSSGPRACRGDRRRRLRRRRIAWRVRPMPHQIAPGRAPSRPPASG